MMSLTKALFRMFLRNPWSFILTTVVSIVFSYIFASIFQTSGTAQVEVPIVLEEGVVIAEQLKNNVEQGTSYSVVWTDEEQMNDLIRKGKAQLGVRMGEEHFTMVVGIDSPHVSIMHQHMQQAYTDHAKTEYIIEEGAKRTGKKSEEVRSSFEKAMNEPTFTLASTENKDADSNSQAALYFSLFGMTLFFVIYTIAFNINQLMVDKDERIWDRMIMSPLKKWEIYGAYILYSFLLGYAQVILIFVVFRYVVGISFHGHLLQAILLLIPYVFAIVALSMFLTGISKSVRHFNTIISIGAVCMAMIGGAFWSLELVSSPVMLTLAEFVPVTYAIQLLEGTVVYGKSFSELFYPISVLLLMGVVLIGIGIHLIERRQV